MENNINVQSKVDLSGNNYTESVSGNDKLSTQDFLNIMIQELKMQDPTKPMDSQKMLDNQMKISGINSNIEMMEMIKNLLDSFNGNNITTASLLIDKEIETNDNKSLVVKSIEQIDNKVYLNTLDKDDNEVQVPFTNITKIL